MPPRTSLPFVLAIAAAAVAIQGGAARAQDAIFTQERNGFELNLGAGAIVLPSYPGSARSRVIGAPYINGGYDDWLDFDVLDGLRLSALRGAGFSFGPALRLREGRDSDRVPRGLRRFSDTIEGGAFVSYENGPVYADVSLTQDLARSHGGAVLDTRLLLSVPIGRVALSAGPRVRAVSRTYAQSFYGIDDEEARQIGVPAHRTGAGLERIGGILAAQWRINEQWNLQGYVEYGRLRGDAATSPLVRGAGGSVNQVQGGAFLSYRLY